MNVIDTGIGTTDDLDGISLDAQTGDGGVIHFDLGPQSGTVNPRSERTETEILSDLVSPGQSQDGGVTAGDMSSMFSVGEFKEHSN